MSGRVGAAARASGAAGAVVALLWVGACAGGLRPITSGEPVTRDSTTLPVERAGPVAESGPPIRVALVTAAGSVRLGSRGAWRLEGAGGAAGAGGVLVRSGGAPDAGWRVERRGSRLRAVREDGLASAWREGVLVARPDERDGTIALDGRRYRGELLLIPTDSGVMVINRLALEDYLRGVVPLEIGADRRPDERAAVEAQAVAARSYVVARLRETARQPYDIGAGALDQVYGGAEAERELADAAVRATAGLVLLHEGRVASAPYHSACGGTTAEPSEVWDSGPVPYLRRVSDRVPGTDGNYCDIAPRATWTRTLEQDALRRTLERYLPAYLSVPAGGVGNVREVRVEETTPSGRVARLAFVTDRGVFRLRANQIRFVLRDAAGGILNSTYFTVSRPPVRRGESAPVATLVGRGNGHGVGMCQWGAIGRARAGQDFRTILRTYYPGTSVGYLR